MSWVAAAAVVGGAVIGAGTSIYGANKAADASKDATGASVAEQGRQYDQTRADFAPYREVGRGALANLADIYGVARPTVTSDLPGAKYGRVAAPVHDAYWTGTDQEWDAWMRSYLAGNPSTVQGPKGINNYLRDYAGREIAKQDALGPATQAGYYINGARSDTQPVPGTTGTAPAGTGSPVDRTGGFYASPGYQFRLDEGNKAIQRSAAARGKLFSGDALKAVTGYSQGVASDEFARYVAGLQSLAGVGQSATGSTATAGANAANNNSAAYLQNGANVGSSYMAAAGGVNNALQGGMGNYLMYRYLKP